MIRKLSFLVAIALGVAACSSDTTDQTAPPATLESSSTAATEPPPAPAAGQAATAAEDTEDHAEEDAGDTVHEDATGHSEDGAEHDGEASTASDAASSGTAGRAVEVSMTELAFTPDQLTVIAGETVTFHVSNDGLVVHEFRLSNAHRIEEHIASGHEGHGDGGGHHDDADVVLELEPGETGAITVTFPEDTTIFTEVACLIPGHYEGGMKAPVDYA